MALLHEPNVSHAPGYTILQVTPSPQHFTQSPTIAYCEISGHSHARRGQKPTYKEPTVMVEVLHLLSYILFYTQLLKQHPTLVL